MPGLVPGIHVLHHPSVLGGYVYILASAPNGILYIGVTNDLPRRIYEHRNGLVAGSIRSSASSTLNIMKRFRLRSSESTT
jgi:putative endonuclease